jgi:sulfur transfer complex TusBCD TusB component (DsrH family)
VQNGVLPARKGSKYSTVIADLLKSKIKVVADRFSLKERGIRQVVEGVDTADTDRLVDLLVEPGTKAIWH